MCSPIDDESLNSHMDGCVDVKESHQYNRKRRFEAMETGLPSQTQGEQ